MKKYATMILVLSLTLFSYALNSEAETGFQQFYQDVNKAYANYRAALFQTNKQDQTKSLKAATQFQQQWEAIIAGYAGAPPEIFSTDPQWESTLEKIDQIATKGLKEIQGSHLGEAHETLEAIRDELTELRRRNHVIIFSDHVNNYHEVMEHLLNANYTLETLDAKAVNHIREQLAVLEYLAEVMKKNAPQEYAGNEQFQQLLKGLFDSLKTLRKTLENDVPEEIVKAVQNLKAPYAKLFVNFG